MKRSLACAVVLALLLGGCSHDTSAGIAGGNPWTHPGVLRWGLNSEPDTLNPMLSSLQVTIEVSMLWAGYLFNYDDRNQLEPELATVVPTPENGGISKDGLSITYHLRKGVRWQDGAAFTADDVLYSWQQVMNPANNVPSRDCYNDITRIDRVDDHTIVVRLAKPYAPFVDSFFTMSAFPYAVLPRHLLAQYHDLNHISFNTMPIGTGPFRVVSYTHGEGMRLEANSDYWRGPPKLHEIDVSFVPDENTLINQARAHEVDLVTNVPMARALDVQHIDGVHVYAIPFTYFTYLAFNTAAAPESDERVRHALVMAIDHRALVEQVTHGYSLLADSDQPQFLWAHAQGLPELPYDPAAAGKLLDSAGWRMAPDGFRYQNGRRLTLVLASSAGSASYKEAEQIVQADWRAVGVDLVLKNLPDSVLYAPESEGGIFASGKFDAFINGWFNGVDPDDTPMFACDQRPPNGDNYTRFCDPVIEAAEHTAITSYSQRERAAAYARVQEELARRTPSFFLWFAKRIDIANSDLRDYNPAHAATTFWNSWEWSI